MRVHSFVPKSGQKGEAARSFSCGKLGFPGSGKTVLGVSPSLAVPTSGYAKHARLCSHLPLWAWGDRRHSNQGRHLLTTHRTQRWGDLSLVGQGVPHTWESQAHCPRSSLPTFCCGASLAHLQPLQAHPQALAPHIPALLLSGPPRCQSLPPYLHIPFLSGGWVSPLPPPSMGATAFPGSRTLLQWPLLFWGVRMLRGGAQEIA